MNKNISFI